MILTVSVIKDLYYSRTAPTLLFTCLKLSACKH